MAHLNFSTTIAAVGGELVTRELIEELLGSIEVSPPEGAATEETLASFSGKFTVSDSVGGVLSAYSGADGTNILRGNTASADLTTPVSLIAADSAAYFRLEELHLSVLDPITVTLKVGSDVLWQFAGPGQDHFVSLFGLAPSTAGDEAVTIEADAEGDVVAFVAVRRVVLPSV